MCSVSGGDSRYYGDGSSDTLNLDPGEGLKKISSRTKAIIRGGLCRASGGIWLPFRDLAAQHGLVMIEDDCHALGAELFGQARRSTRHDCIQLSSGQATYTAKAECHNHDSKLARRAALA